MGLYLLGCLLLVWIAAPFTCLKVWSILYGGIDFTTYVHPSASFCGWLCSCAAHHGTDGSSMSMVTSAVCMHSAKDRPAPIFAPYIIYTVCCEISPCLVFLQKRGMARIQRTHHPIFQGSLETSTFRPLDGATGCGTDSPSPSPAPASQPCHNDEAAAQVNILKTTCTGCGCFCHTLIAHVTLNPLAYTVDIVPRSCVEHLSS